MIAQILITLFATIFHADQGGIGLSADGRGFVHQPDGRPFVVRGFNYDHDEKGRLIEDYWHDEWSKVEADFREMRDLGATVVRIHLQVGRFLDGPDAPNAVNLERLGKLLALAEELGLVLDLTGLGCYHKADVPAWYDALDEPGRWAAQARFWSAVAERCAGSPAVFCYDLMNEPIVAGEKRPPGDWLAGAFAGKHFVQFVTLDPAGRDREETARRWVEQMTAAIRRHDPKHLITVGMLPPTPEWGWFSGFRPDEIAPSLDFLSVHVYPEKGKVPEAVEIVAQAAKPGKPVVIEETFPLKCSCEELERFLVDSRPHAAGFIGFYWGQTIEELAKPATIGEAITRDWLRLFARLSNR